MLEIGINTNCECGETVEETLANIQSVGFENVMVAFKCSNTIDLIEKTQDAGLNIVYAHLDTSRADDLWTVGESNEHYVNEMCNQIKICGKYHIPIAIMHANEGNPSRLVLPPNEHGIKSMLRILEVAKNENVKIALENVDKPNSDRFTYLLDNIKSDHFGFCYDVGHHQLYNPELDLLGMYGNRMMAIHLHDNLMDWHYGYDYTRDLHRLPFDGIIDYVKICDNLKEIKYSGFVMLEVRKFGMGEPRIYKDMLAKDYLNEAYIRGIKIKDILKK